MDSTDITKARTAHTVRAFLYRPFFTKYCTHKLDWSGFVPKPASPQQILLASPHQILRLPIITKEESCTRYRVLS